LEELFVIASKLEKTDTILLEGASKLQVLCPLSNSDIEFKAVLVRNLI
jgi:hypothetical protein